MKAEVLENGAFLTLADARIEIGDYIDNYRAGGPYNTVRLHSALGRAAFGYLSPMQFELQTKG